MTTTEETDMSEVHPYQPSEGACETGARQSFLWLSLPCPVRHSRSFHLPLRASPPFGPVSDRMHGG